MTQEEIQTLKCLKKKLEEEVIKLFNYIYDTYNDVLTFRKLSSYNYYDIDEDIIRIEYFDYGYDCYESGDIEIPINDFVSNPFEWADNWAKQVRAEKRRVEDAKKIREEEEERKEYERLKNKYEKL